MAFVLVVTAGLAGCQATPGKSAVAGASGAITPGVSGTSTDSAVPSPSAAQGAPQIAITPADDAPVRADRPVTVSVVNGSLSQVRLANAAGQQVAGEVDVTGTWRNTQPLTAGTKYTVTATATAAAQGGPPVTSTATFSTVKATRLISTTLIPGDDWTVGVGMPVIVVFSQPVKNRAAAIAALQVNSTPAVDGGWRWFTSSEVHWRPRDYWPSGTKVEVTAATSGTELAQGAWGKRTVTSRFTVGQDQRMTVNMAKHTLSFSRDGAVVRTIPVTTGKSGFATRNGIKVVMDRQPQVTMDAESTGIRPGDPEYYNLNVKWAMRLTYSGEFLHAAPWSVGSQGRANVSHGCTGMSTANARWLFDNSKIGDVVQFTGGSRKLEWSNGYTDWNLPFEKYVAQA